MGGKGRRELLLTMREAPKVEKCGCDWCRAANVCMLQRCGDVDINLKKVYIYKQWVGCGSDRIVVKTTSRRCTQYLLYAKK